MNKKIVLSFVTICLSAAGFAQTATTSGKIPAQVPAKNESAATAPEAQKVVSADKDATVQPAAGNDQPLQTPPQTGNEKVTGIQKKPE